MIGPSRVAAIAGAPHAPEILRDFSTVIGIRIHREEMPITPESCEQTLAELDLPLELARPAKSTEYDEALTVSHRAGPRPTPELRAFIFGPDEVPVAFFGPVVTPAPRREKPGRLRDGAVAGVETGGFLELNGNESDLSPRKSSFDATLRNRPGVLWDGSVSLK